VKDNHSAETEKDQRVGLINYFVIFSLTNNSP
jgi:hypothetical protein